MEQTKPQSENKEDGPITIEEKVTKSNGEITFRQYTRSKMLGKGGFAKCYQIINQETKKVSAAQIIPKNTLTKNRQRQQLISEIQIHQSLSHDYIVQFQHVFEDQQNVYIILQLCTNQTLNELVKRRQRLTEIEVQCYLVQIVSALQYLHSNQIIHRDLKLGNLFISEQMELQLGDFGLATQVQFEGEKKRTICGTPNYIAPEILDSQIGHSYEVDTWSLGVLIYALLIGKPPFETPEVKSTYQKIKANSYSFPETISIPESARNLISKILQLDPTKRPNLDQILAHPFLNTGGSIPQVLPVSTLACPPSLSFTKQFIAPNFPQSNSTSSTTNTNKLRLNSVTSTNALESGILSPNTGALNEAIMPNGPMPPTSSGVRESRHQFASSEKVNNNIQGTNIQDPLASAYVSSQNFRRPPGTSSSVQPRVLTSNNNNNNNNNGNNGAAPTAVNNWVNGNGSNNSNAYQMVNPSGHNNQDSIQVQDFPTSTVTTAHSVSRPSTQNMNGTGNGGGMMDVRTSVISSIGGGNSKSSTGLIANGFSSGGTVTNFNSQNSLGDKGKPGHIKYQSSLNPSSSTGFHMGGVQSQHNLNQGSNLLGNIGVSSSVYSNNLNNLNSSPEICVQSWVDYSSKYGMGYLLTNGCIGVCFNDTTQAILDPTSTFFEYLEQKPSDKQESINTYKLKDYPKDMQQKATLLQHFQSYLDVDSDKATTTGFGSAFSSPRTSSNANAPNLDSLGKTNGFNQSQPLVYVKKWMKTRHAIMFRLSNQIVQVNFTDQTEILLSSENKVVIYINQKGEVFQYPLSNALQNSNTEMTKRLKYTKEILTHMLQNNPNFVPQTVPTN